MNTTLKIISVSLFAASISACTAITDFTSSTSSTLDAVTPDVTLNEFVNKRYVAIRQDAANGGGENLDALAHLMGNTNSAELAQLMQTNFESIFKDVSKPDQIIARIEAASSQPKG